MLDKTSIRDLQKTSSIFIQFLFSKFQPMGQSHAADCLHHLPNTISIFYMFVEEGSGVLSRGECDF